MTHARLRPQAERDLVRQTSFSRAEGGTDLGARFFDAAIEAVASIEEMPGLGSPLVGELFGIPGLRRAAITGFPCGWYYVERPDHVDVIRLLSDRRDLELLLDGVVAPDH